ncbi:MAG TPA: hypothetical protein ENJ28_01150 [Gammaproteobacteria bacterium]|nr:hypothetical protein [Gammaproteobacteria bacterium]
MNDLKTVYFAATGKEIHIDIPLSNVAIDFTPTGMIADMIAPVVGVPNISGVIPTFDRADTYRIEDSLRAQGTEANRVTRNVSSDNFLCLNYALMDGITIEDRNNADPIYVQKLFNGGAEWLKTKLMLGWEDRIATKVTNTSNVGSSSAVGSAWTDYTNSDPLGDVQTIIDNVQDAQGVKPNRVVMSDEAWRNFRRNTTVRNLIFGINNGGGYASPEQAADLLDVDKILIGGAYKDTGAEGLSESLSQIWGDHVLAYYAPEQASIQVPSFMYSFRWQTADIPNMQVERHPFDTRRKCEDIELGYYQDEKITYSGVSFLLTNVTSST